MEPSSCVWVEGERTDGLVSVCRQPEKPQPWRKALSEVDSTGQWWSGANARVDCCASIHCPNTGRSDCWAAKRESFMHKTFVFLVVAFNVSIQTKPFLYENSLNYYHLKIGLTQASLIRFQFRFLQILAAFELFTQPVLVGGGSEQGRGGFFCSKYLESKHDARYSHLYQGSSHMSTYLDQNGFTDILISLGNSFI